MSHHHHTTNTDTAAIGLVAASLYDPKKPDNGLGGVAVGALAAVNPVLGLAAAGLSIAADCSAYRSDLDAARLADERNARREKEQTESDELRELHDERKYAERRLRSSNNTARSMYCRGLIQSSEIPSRIAELEADIAREIAEIDAKIIDITSGARALRVEQAAEAAANAAKAAAEASYRSGLLWSCLTFLALVIGAGVLGGH